MTQIKWYRGKIRENQKPAWFRRVLHNGTDLFIVAYKGGDLRYKFRMMWEEEVKKYIKSARHDGKLLVTKYSEELEHAFWRVNLGVWTHKGSDTIQEDRNGTKRSKQK